MLRKFELTTDKHAFYRITDEVRKAVKESGIKDGIAVVYCPHTTAGITINENADGHVKCSVMGASETLIIENGDIILGRWQDVYFTEFDPPRQRYFYVKIIGG